MYVCDRMYVCLYALQAEVHALWYFIPHTTDMCVCMYACICMFVHVRNVYVCV